MKIGQTMTRSAGGNAGFTTENSLAKRIEVLQNERAQLEQDAQRLGINSAGEDNPIAVSHRAIVGKIDAELEVLLNRQTQLTQRADSAKPVEEVAEKPVAEAPKQIVLPTPDKRGIYPPGTFLDRYV